MKTLLFVAIAFFFFYRPCLAQKISLKLEKQIKSQKIGYIFDLSVNKKGDIFLTDAIGDNVKKFSSDGHLTKVIGRKGKGPGEFQVPKNIAVLYPFLYVYDSNSLRISIFNLRPKLTLEKTIALKPTASGTPDGLLFASQKVIFGTYSKAYSKKNLKSKHHTVLNTINYKGKIVNHSVLSVPAKEYLVTRDGSGFSVGPKPFGRKPVFATGMHDTFYYGNTNTLEIRKYSTKGKMLQMFKKRIKKIRITGNDLTNKSKDPRYTSKEIQQFKDGNTDTFPAFDWFVVDKQGRLWVAVNTKSRKDYSLFIFNNKGKVINKTPLAKSVELKEIRAGYAYGIKTNAKGVQSVVRYKIKGLK